MNKDERARLFEFIEDCIDMSGGGGGIPGFGAADLAAARHLLLMSKAIVEHRLDEFPPLEALFDDPAMEDSDAAEMGAP
jgi:hypothetical protein